MYKNCQKNNASFSPEERLKKQEYTTYRPMLLQYCLEYCCVLSFLFARTDTRKYYFFGFGISPSRTVWYCVSILVFDTFDTFPASLYCDGGSLQYRFFFFLNSVFFSLSFTVSNHNHRRYARKVFKMYACFFPFLFRSAGFVRT